MAPRTSTDTDLVKKNHLLRKERKAYDSTYDSERVNLQDRIHEVYTLTVVSAVIGQHLRQ